jgi:hypothetical protein
VSEDATRVSRSDSSIQAAGLAGRARRLSVPDGNSALLDDPFSHCDTDLPSGSFKIIQNVTERRCYA